MGIKKRFFILLSATMLSMLTVSYAIIYQYLYLTMYEETVTKQQGTVELNRQMADNFLQSVNHTAVQVVSDKSLGEYLSADNNDIITALKSRDSIRTQFSHYAAHQVIDSTYSYRSTLFLSDDIPISAYFDDYTLDNNPFTASSNVFSNTNAKEHEWYQQTVEQTTYTFNNTPTNEFCIAKKLNNTYYLGPSNAQGHAVMVISIPLGQLEKVFSSTQITPYSGYSVLNQDGEILFCSNSDIGTNAYAQTYSTYQQNHESEFEATIQSDNYLVSYCQTRYGIQLLFLTPEQDIKTSILPLMQTYTLFFAGIFLVSLPVIYILTSRLTRPLITLSTTISSIKDTRLFDKSSLNVSHETELVILQNSFSEMIDNTNQLIEDIQMQDERQKLSQLQALQAQINPHFIFNTMDMVNWLALTRGCDDIANIVDSIANLMRYSITDPDGMVPISQEMDNIREFVSVYQLRHNNTLQLTDQSTDSGIMIPKFTLQPLVENSIRHAKPPSSQNLTIVVTACQKADQSIIEIKDNGTKGKAEQLNQHLHYEDSGLKVSSGFGIRNVNERIHLRFSDNSGLTYYNQEGGLAARIILNNKQQGSTSL